jgi:hypothetical protein
MEEIPHISPYRKQYNRLDSHLIFNLTRRKGITFRKMGMQNLSHNLMFL